jgi:Metallo-beta-lactamase superfamily
MPGPNERYISARDTFLFAEARHNSDVLNHLLLGDWVKTTGAESNGWIPVKARGDNGWLPVDVLTLTRPLEINFVDIGQGDGCHIVTPDDRVILIDAGIGDNMARFLSWRYNLRGRKVKGVENVAATDPAALDPFLIDTVVMSHPDEDHYGGLTPIFRNPKLRFNRIFHNGIVERPIAASDKIAGLTYGSSEDIGGWLTVSGRKLLWETVQTDAEIKALSAKHPSTTKRLLTAFRSAIENSPNVNISSLSVRDGVLPGLSGATEPVFKVLGPFGEDASFQGQSRYCLPKLGNEGETKNGHSVVFRMTFGKLSVLLGGDLNTQSEDHLARQHLNLSADLSSMWKDAEALRRKGSRRTAAEDTQWQSLKTDLDLAVAEGRKVFRVDVAKACHHGSHHFTEPFLQMIDATATVISSGDAESYSHPRPDALGAFGKYGRGIRPLIFSTELARSTRESSPLARYVPIIDGFRNRIATAATEQQRSAIQKEMDAYRDRHVAVYGMITLRTDGEKAILAQKLEVPNGDSKWDIHELVWNDDIDEFEYLPKGGH